MRKTNYERIKLPDGTDVQRKTSEFRVFIGVALYLFTEDPCFHNNFSLLTLVKKYLWKNS